MFGDDTWPTATDWVIPLISLIACVLTMAGCTVIARSYGRQRETAAHGNVRHDRSQINLLTLAPLALIALFVITRRP